MEAFTVQNADAVIGGDPNLVFQHLQADDTEQRIHVYIRHIVYAALQIAVIYSGAFRADIQHTRIIRIRQKAGYTLDAGGVMVYVFLKLTVLYNKEVILVSKAVQPAVSAKTQLLDICSGDLRIIDMSENHLGCDHGYAGGGSYVDRTV